MRKGNVLASQYITAFGIILMYIKTSFRSATDISEYKQSSGAPSSSNYSTSHTLQAALQGMAVSLLEREELRSSFPQEN